MKRKTYFVKRSFETLTDMSSNGCPMPSNVGFATFCTLKTEQSGSTTIFYIGRWKNCFCFLFFMIVSYDYCFIFCFYFEIFSFCLYFHQIHFEKMIRLIRTVIRPICFVRLIVTFLLVKFRIVRLFSSVAKLTK